MPQNFEDSVVVIADERRGMNGHVDTRMIDSDLNDFDSYDFDDESECPETDMFAELIRRF